MKSDMKNNLFCLVVLGLGLMLGACVKDDPTGPGTPFRFNISIRDPQVVETRSAATGGELTIDDAYVLEFNADGTFKNGDKVPVSSIVGNGTRNPSLLMKHGFAEGNRIVCLLNSGMAELPAGLQPGVSTVADLNTLFPATSWNMNRSGAEGDRGVPMYGEMDYAFGVDCPVRRSVAKITLELAGSGRRTYRRRPELGHVPCARIRQGSGLRPRRGDGHRYGAGHRGCGFRQYRVYA